MSFGQHLRSLREAAGLSRAELARRAGVPASILRNREGDRGMPGVPALLRLAEALGVPVERLAEGVEDPRKTRRHRRRSPAGTGRETDPERSKGQPESLQRHHGDGRRQLTLRRSVRSGFSLTSAPGSMMISCRLPERPVPGVLA
jgi:transcriptional regulator with XRE-family HTH domain